MPVHEYWPSWEKVGVTFYKDFSPAAGFQDNLERRTVDVAYVPGCYWRGVNRMIHCGSRGELDATSLLPALRVSITNFRCHTSTMQSNHNRSLVFMARHRYH